MKTLFVPGWMKSVGYYGNFEGLDVWKKEFVPGDFRTAECVVAHSMGAAYALADEHIGNEKTRYVLINPIIRKTSFFSWVWRWVRFVFSGGVKIDSRMGAGNIFSAMRKAFRVAGLDLDGALEKIPSENIVIIRGSRDKYFCDQRMAEAAAEKGIKTIEAEGLGHEWDEKYLSILASLI